jgi:hypothetical protein
MLRLSKIFRLTLALIPCVSLATAHEFICPDETCFPGYFNPGPPIWRPHNFHPRLRDGLPLVNDFQTDPEGYHGVGCVWSRRPVASPKGPVWGMVPFCLDY